MKILLIYTGGTIGSTTRDGYIDTNATQCGQLLSRYDDYAKTFRLEPVTFTTVSPYVILSENLTLSHIASLYQCIRRQLAEDTSYDGIILTHGTDTLQYTAAALCRLFPALPLPLLLVSANYVLDDPRSNGFANFAAAVAGIRRKSLQGVLVSYQNNTAEGADAPVYLYPADTLLPHTLYSDTIHTLHSQYRCRCLPEHTDGQISYEYLEGGGSHADRIQTIDADDSHAGRMQTIDADESHTGRMQTVDADGSHTDRMPPAPAADTDDVLQTFCAGGQPNVLVLTVMPGMYYPVISDTLRGVLLITYHSGTLPTDDTAFRDFVLSAHKKEVPVYVLGTDPSYTPYKSTACYTSLHLTPLPVMTPADAYMWLALGLL